MGQKLKIWAIMTSLVLLSGMLGFGFSPDALATHNDNGKGLAEGCSKGVAKNNPHCNGSGGTIQNSPCNGDGSSDGDITAQELFDLGLTANLTDAQNAIIFAEGGTGNGIIDTQAEYDALKATFPAC